MQGQKRQGGRRRGAAKPKVCQFCESKVNYIDFKDAETLMKFQTAHKQQPKAQVLKKLKQRHQLHSRSLQETRLVNN